MTTVYNDPEGGREVLTASGERMWREDAEALGYTIAPYTDLVAPSERIAATHPEFSDLVTLPPFGYMVTTATAKQMGFAVSKIASPRVTTAPPSRPDPQSTWRSAIMTSPEAKERPAATAELLTTRTPETLTVEQARAFLRGLPIEAEQTETPDTMTTNDDPRAKRLAEIAAIGPALNKAMGYTSERPQPAKASQPAALSNVEPARLKRLAEIRLNALQMNGHGLTQEAKALKLALDTHATTGFPLARALAQLSVDTSKLMPNV